MTDINFTSTAAFDRQYFWDQGGSVRYLAVRLQARRQDADRSAERAPLNIALVIDASGSMGGGKLEAAKAAALGLTDRLTGRDRLTLVSFASDIQLHLDAVPADSHNAIRIRSEISRLRTRGMTNLSGGWFKGIEHAEMIRDEDPRMTPRVIILSDGHANEGITNPHELREHAGQLRMRGVLTSALGIGDGYDEQLLLGIAENGGGRLHDAELDGEISSVLLGELDDIFRTVVEDAQVTLTLPDGMRAELLSAGKTETRDDRILLRLGPIQNDIERVAVFKVTCPRHSENEEIQFKITADGKTADGHQAVKTEPSIARLFAVDGPRNDAQLRDPGIAETVAKAWSAHIVANAARLNRRNFRQAQEFVNNELRFFRRYAEGLHRGRELIREIELLAARAASKLSSRVHKEMVLQSNLAHTGRTDRRGAGKDSWSTRMARSG